MTRYLSQIHLVGKLCITYTVFVYVCTFIGLLLYSTHIFILYISIIARFVFAILARLYRFNSRAVRAQEKFVIMNRLCRLCVYALLFYHRERKNFFCEIPPGRLYIEKEAKNMNT